MRTFIGIDNGVSGSIGIIQDGRAVAYVHTPVKTEYNYTKQEQQIRRINVPELKGLLTKFRTDDMVISLERPMVNPARWKATQSALRSLEATIIVFELLELPYSYCDSKHWQKELLPNGLDDSKQLKVASLQIGKRLFPSIDFTGFEDADGILIAEYTRRHYIV